MDINTIRAIVTIVSLITFIGIVVWAWRRRHTQDFKEAAQLPFLDEPAPQKDTID